MQGHCKKCGEIKTLAPANISRLTGERLYRTWCFDCEKIRKDEWRSLNKDMHNARNAAWVKSNPEKRRASSRKWDDNNRDFRLELQRQWRKNNVYLARSYVAARRKALRNSTPKCLNEFDHFWISEIYHLAQLRRLTVDHVIPLNHKRVCGLHVPWNMSLMDKNSNSRKSNKFEGVATR